MIKINNRFVPSSDEIRKAIKDARRYAERTGNFIQVWFDTIDGEFHTEEFVDSASYVSLPDYCYNVGTCYGYEDVAVEDIKKIAENS